MTITTALIATGLIVAAVATHSGAIDKVLVDNNINIEQAKDWGSKLNNSTIIMNSMADAIETGDVNKVHQGHKRYEDSVTKHKFYLGATNILMNEDESLKEIKEIQDDLYSLTDEDIRELAIKTGNSEDDIVNAINIFGVL